MNRDCKTLRINESSSYHKLSNDCVEIHRKHPDMDVFDELKMLGVTFPPPFVKKDKKEVNMSCLSHSMKKNRASKL